MITLRKQESPPAWTQEAYRPPRSKYTLCCCSWGVPPSWPGTWIEGGFPPILLTRGGVSHPVDSRGNPPSWPEMGVPPCPDLWWGNSLSSPEMGVPHVLTGQGTPPPRHHPGVNWQTENSTFPHPSDAGGNYENARLWMYILISCHKILDPHQ